MSITKRARVSFDLKVVYSSEQIEEMQEQIDEIVRGAAKAVSNETPIPGLIKEIVKAQLTGGFESAIELFIKKLTKEIVTQELLNGDAKRVSNFRVAFRK